MHIVEIQDQDPESLIRLTAYNQMEEPAEKTAIQPVLVKSVSKPNDGVLHPLAAVFIALLAMLYTFSMKNAQMKGIKFTTNNGLSDALEGVGAEWVPVIESSLSLLIFSFGLFWLNLYFMGQGALQVYRTPEALMKPRVAYTSESSTASINTESTGLLDSPVNKAAYRQKGDIRDHSKKMIIGSYILTILSALPAIAPLIQSFGSSAQTAPGASEWFFETTRAWNLSLAGSGAVGAFLINLASCFFVVEKWPDFKKAFTSEHGFSKGEKWMLRVAAAANVYGFLAYSHQAVYDLVSSETAGIPLMIVCGGASIVLNTLMLTVNLGMSFIDAKRRSQDLAASPAFYLKGARSFFPFKNEAAVASLGESPQPVGIPKMLGSVASSVLGSTQNAMTILSGANALCGVETGLPLAVNIGAALLCWTCRAFLIRTANDKRSVCAEMYSELLKIGAMLLKLCFIPQIIGLFSTLVNQGLEGLGSLPARFSPTR